MMTAERKGIIIRKVNKRQKFIKELKLLKDMLMKNNYTRKYAFTQSPVFYLQTIYDRKADLDVY